MRVSRGLRRFGKVPRLFTSNVTYQVCGIHRLPILDQADICRPSITGEIMSRAGLRPIPATKEPRGERTVQTWTIHSCQQLRVLRIVSAGDAWTAFVDHRQRPAPPWSKIEHAHHTW
jgi:hypothetical protein